MFKQKNKGFSLTPINDQTVRIQHQRKCRERIQVYFQLWTKSVRFQHQNDQRTLLTLKGISGTKKNQQVKGTQLHYVLSDFNDLN